MKKIRVTLTEDGRPSVPTRKTKRRKTVGPLFVFLTAIFFALSIVYYTVDFDELALSRSSHRSETAETEPLATDPSASPKMPDAADQVTQSEPAKSGSSAKTVEAAVKNGDAFVKQVSYDRLLTNTLGSAGHPNGSPASPSDPHDPNQFKVYRYHQQIVELNSLKKLPQVIGAKQILRIKVIGFDKGNCILNAIVNSGHPRKLEHYRLKPYAGKIGALRIMLNETKLYDRATPCASNYISTMIPGGLATGSDHLIIANSSDVDLCFDSVWLDKAPDSGGRVWIGLEDAEWLDAQRASVVPQMVVAFQRQWGDVPRQEVDALYHAKRVDAIGTVAERQALWRSYDWVEQLKSLQLTSELEVSCVKEWKTRIADILARGAEPVVRISCNSNSMHPEWLGLFCLFRPFVRHWVLDCAKMGYASHYASFMKRWSPDSELTFSFHNSIKPNKDLFSKAALCVQASSYQLMNQKLGELRKSLLLCGADYPRLFNPMLCSRQLAGANGHEAQCWTAHELPKLVVGWLHNGGNQVVLSGGSCGGGMFPEKADQPAMIWDVVRRLLPIGRGDARRIPCNLSCPNEEMPLLDTSYVAVANSPTECTILIHAAEDVGRVARIDCLVPWMKGDAVATIDTMELFTDKEPVCGEVVKTPLSVATSGNRGLVQTFVNLSGLTVIKIRKKDSAILQQPILVKHAKDELRSRFSSTLLSTSLNAFPEHWWIEPLCTPGQKQEWVTSDPRFKVESVTATPGKFGREAQFIPQFGKSSLLSMPKLERDDKQPMGYAACVHLNRQKFFNAQAIGLWVYPRASSTSVNVLAGTFHHRGRILLKTNQWHFVTVPVSKLMKDNPNGSIQFYFWPDPNDCRRSKVSFEFNGFNGYGAKAPGGMIVSNQSKLLDMKDNNDKRLFLLVGPVGQPVFVHRRLSTSLFCSGLAVSDKSASVCFYPESQWLSAGIVTMPKTDEQSLKKHAELLPVALRTETKAGKMNVIAISPVDAN